MNNIPLLAVLKLINKMIKINTVTVSGKDGYKWTFKMDEINKLKQMNKNISLTLAILNTIMFGLYFTQLTQVETYQWIITPLFIVFFTNQYMYERNKTK